MTLKENYDSMSRKQQLTKINKQFKIADECAKISRDFMKRIPDILDTLYETDPYKAIQAWKEITLFAEAQKSKDTPTQPPMNVNITMIPARPDKESKYIDITHQQKLENE